MLNRIKAGFVSGKRRHFSFMLGIGVGYLQYRFFHDLFTNRAEMFDRSSALVTKLLSEVNQMLYFL